MDAPIATFSPDLSAGHFTLLGSLLLAGLALGGIIYLQRRPVGREYRSHRTVGLLLLFFVFLLAAGTAFFTWWFRHRTGDIILYADAIELSSRRVDLADIRNAYLRSDQRTSMLNPSIKKGKTTFLLIEETNGKVHVFSEDHYPVRQILQQLKEVVQAPASEE